ncbi:putative YIF1 [Blattamonas nauphoetae]|uniref:YIF1 n=1 Tax=Blattamonas nauphoetae TaxID=2049346 RepID=A0ABQ9Y9D1_9EUKA|nr:putative YIF1 [Blattamonas nauphoetae]
MDKKNPKMSQTLPPRAKKPVISAPSKDSSKRSSTPTKRRSASPMKPPLDKPSKQSTTVKPNQTNRERASTLPRKAPTPKDRINSQDSDPFSGASAKTTTPAIVPIGQTQIQPSTSPKPTRSTSRPRTVIIIRQEGADGTIESQEDIEVTPDMIKNTLLRGSQPPLVSDNQSSNQQTHLQPSYQPQQPTQPSQTQLLFLQFLRSLANVPTIITQALLPANQKDQQQKLYSHFRTFFNISINSIIQKLTIMFFPFPQKEWRRSNNVPPQEPPPSDSLISEYVPEPPAPPSPSWNDPELYLAAVSSVTFALLLCLVAVMWGLPFNPSLIVKVVSFAFGSTFLLCVVSLLLITLFVPSTAQQPLSTKDNLSQIFLGGFPVLMSLHAHKFVFLCGWAATRLLLGKFLSTVSLLYLLICNFLFSDNYLSFSILDLPRSTFLKVNDDTHNPETDHSKMFLTSMSSIISAIDTFFMLFTVLKFRL